MTESIQKQVLLQKMQDGYSSFSAFIDTLDRDQLTKPGVNGKWSVKDNLAHLSSWQRRTINAVHSVRDKKNLPDPTPGMSEDEINEQFYQANRDRTLEEVQTEFQEISQQLIASVQELTEAQINAPLPWNKEQNIWPNILGNTSEHYEEHSQIIKRWLARQEQGNN